MTEIIVCICAGLLAGVGTGFAGLSAAVFIAPMLTTLLGVDSFSAVGVALASDVLASAVSALNYTRKGNTELKKIIPLLAAVLAAAILGTAASHLLTGFSLGEQVMSWWLLLAMLALGGKLLLFPAKSSGSAPARVSRLLIMLLGGCYIGFVCGFQGTGGGLMLLFTLNILLGMDFKKSVGSSVCIMSATALIGALSHFSIRGMADTKQLLLCMLFTLFGADIASIAANRMDQTLLKRLTGGLMTFTALGMLAIKLF